MSVTYDKKFGEWGILGHGLDHNYYLLKVISIIWGYVFIEKIRHADIKKKLQQEWRAYFLTFATLKGERSNKELNYVLQWINEEENKTYACGSNPPSFFEPHPINQ